MTARPLTRFAVVLGAFASTLTTTTAQASSPASDAASCYTEAVFRLAEPLDDEPSDTQFHSVGAGAARCTGILDGRSLDPSYGEFTASGTSVSTSCQTGSGAFLGHLRVRDLAGQSFQVPIRVSFTRLGLTGSASGETVSRGARIAAAFAAEPLDGDCANTAVEHVRIRVDAQIGG